MKLQKYERLFYTRNFIRNDYLILSLVPGQVNGQGLDLGEQYLSKIFYHTETQYKLADKVIQHLHNIGYKVATKLQPATTFWKAEAYHQQYYNKNSGQPYCHFWKKIF